MLMTVQMGGRRRTHSECVGRKCSRCRCLRIERLSNLPLRIASHHLGLFCLSSRQPRLWQWVSWKPACLIAALLDVKVMMLLPLRLGQWGSLKPACLIAVVLRLEMMLLLLLLAAAAAVGSCADAGRFLVVVLGGEWWFLVVLVGSWPVVRQP